jgi:hypothetical protein
VLDTEHGDHVLHSRSGELNRTRKCAYKNAKTPVRIMRETGVGLRRISVFAPGYDRQAMRGLWSRLPMPRQSATRFLPGGVMLCMHPPLIENAASVRLIGRNVKMVTGAFRKIVVVKQNRSAHGIGVQPAPCTECRDQID